MPKSKDKQVAKKRRGPEDLPETTFGTVLFYAIFSGLAGVFIAFVLCASFTPQVVQDEATLEATLDSWGDRPRLPGDSLVLRSPEGRADGWSLKVAALTSGSEADVTLSAAEVNGWIQAQLANIQPVSGSQSFSLVPRRPAIALRSEGRVQFTIQTELHFFGKVYPLQLIADGVVDGESSRAFEIRRLRWNAAQVPPVPGLRTAMVRRVLGAYAAANGYAEMRDVLSRAKRVEASPAGIRIVI